MTKLRKPFAAKSVRRGSKSEAMKPERQIELEILFWLNSQPGCRAWKNKSQGTFDPRRGVFRKSAHRFSEKGTSDILGIYRGHMICIEVKSAKGRVMPHQAEFIENMAELGAIAFIARSLDDVRGILLSQTIARFLEE